MVRRFLLLVIAFLLAIQLAMPFGVRADDPSPAGTPVDEKKAEVPPTGNEVLDELIRQVLERNPALKKVKNRSLASKELIEPAGTLPDPIVGISFSNAPVDDFNLSREPMTSKDIFVAQKIPFPGKLSLRAEIAEINSKVSELSVEEMKNLLIFRTKKAFYALARIRRDIQITEKTRALFSEYAEVARKLYEVGKAKQQDLFRAQTEVFNLDRRLERLRELEREAVALLNTLRSYPVDYELREVGFPDKMELSLELDRLLEIAKAKNPGYLKRLSKIEADEKAVALAKRDLYPDFTLQARYKQRDGRSDYITGAVSLNVPIFAGRKQKKLIKHREFRLSSEREELGNFLDRLRYQLKSSILAAKSSKEELMILEEAVLPEAKRTVESALSYYSVGELEFNTLVRAALELFKYELEEAKLEAKYHTSIAKIRMLTGEN